MIFQNKNPLFLKDSLYAQSEDMIFGIATDENGKIFYDDLYVTKCRDLVAEEWYWAIKNNTHPHLLMLASGNFKQIKSFANAIYKLEKCLKLDKHSKFCYYYKSRDEIKNIDPTENYFILGIKPSNFWNHVLRFSFLTACLRRLATNLHKIKDDYSSKDLKAFLRRNNKYFSNKKAFDKFVKGNTEIDVVKVLKNVMNKTRWLDQCEKSAYRSISKSSQELLDSNLGWSYVFKPKFKNEKNITRE